MKHSDKIQKGDLLVLDRGYVCIWLLFLLKAKGSEFCIRMKDDWWLEVNEFLKSGENERIVGFKLPSKDHQKLASYKEITGEVLQC